MATLVSTLPFSTSYAPGYDCCSLPFKYIFKLYLEACTSCTVDKSHLNRELKSPQLCYLLDNTGVQSHVETLLPQSWWSAVWWVRQLSVHCCSMSNHVINVFPQLTSMSCIHLNGSQHLSLNWVGRARHSRVFCGFNQCPILISVISMGSCKKDVTGVCQQWIDVHCSIGLHLECGWLTRLSNRLLSCFHSVLMYKSWICN